MKPIAILPIINRLANRWNRFRLYLDQILSAQGDQLQCVNDRKYSQVSAIFCNNSDLTRFNLAINKCSHQMWA